MVRVFKTRSFRRFMRKEGLTDDALRDAVSGPSAGLLMPTLEAESSSSASRGAGKAALADTAR